MHPIGVGIVGCGNVLDAYRAALQPLENDAWVHVRHLCGRPSQAERARTAFPHARFTTSLRPLLDSPGISLVLVLTSMASHAPVARAALDAGKHVLVEKPLALDIATARSLIDHARRRNLRLAAAPFTLLSPTFQTIAGRLQRGDIGKPCLARARYGWSGPSWSPWFYGRNGGCLLDLGIYSVTSLTGLLGPARRVQAFAGVAIPKRRIGSTSVRVTSEDNAQILLDFGRATFASVTTGFTLQQYRSPALEIYGSTGVLQMLGDDWDPDGYEFWDNRVGAWQCYRETHPDWPWTDGLRHLVDCLRRNQELLTTPRHALHVLDVLLAARRSARTGRAEPVSTRFHPPRFELPHATVAAHEVHDRARPHASPATPRTTRPPKGGRSP